MTKKANANAPQTTAALQAKADKAFKEFADRLISRAEARMRADGRHPFWESPENRAVIMG